MRNIIGATLAAVLAVASQPSQAAIPLLESSPPELRLAPVARYATGLFDEAAAEISAYDPESRLLFVVNGGADAIDLFRLAIDPPRYAIRSGNPSLRAPRYSLKEQMRKYASFSLGEHGNPNSVAFKNGVLAVAVGAPVKTDPGKVVLMNRNGQVLSVLTVGALPDMVTFTPDGNTLLVANEGEPSDDYTVDPEGSVSLIDLRNGAANLTQADVATLGFGGFDPAAIDPAIRRYGPNATLAQDLEPEYIAVSPDGSRAWVTLQENNALALVDLTSRTITGLAALGTKDHGVVQNALDAGDKDGEIAIRPWPVRGLYLPDAIAAYDYAGESYLVLANEGDTRDWDGYSEEARVADLTLDPVAFPDAESLQPREALGRLKVTNSMGDTDGDGDYDALYSFGGRSFSIRKADGELVYDSGSDIERLIAGLNPEFFNSDAGGGFDSRSDDKGPEPEGVAIGQIDGRTYAFIGLERDSGILAYDVTLPYAPRFVFYANTRDFAGDAELGTGGDQGPEGLTFIPATQSPTGKPLLAVAFEVSGSTTVFQIETVE